MMVKEDAKEEERSAEPYVSVHGGLDHTFVIEIFQTSFILDHTFVIEIIQT